MTKQKAKDPFRQRTDKESKVWDPIWLNKGVRGNNMSSFCQIFSYRIVILDSHSVRYLHTGFSYWILILSDLCIPDSSMMQQSEELKHSHFVRSLHTRFSYWILIPSDLCIPDGSPASEEGQQEDPQWNWVNIFFHFFSKHRWKYLFYYFYFKHRCK